MLKTLRVSAMLLALAGAARAGEIIVPPAPQPVKTNTVQESPVNYEDDATYIVDTAEETDILMQIAIDLLVSALP
jgi:predicted small lipoprotein YifL